ncbi:probable methyltransferase PMT11 [Tanacetum coccineum]
MRHGNIVHWTEHEVQPPDMSARTKAQEQDDLNATFCTDAILLIEVNRLLWAGGNFAWAAQSVYKHEPLLEEQWEVVSSEASESRSDEALGEKKGVHHTYLKTRGGGVKKGNLVGLGTRGGARVMVIRTSATSSSSSSFAHLMGSASSEKINGFTAMEPECKAKSYLNVML